MLTFTRTTYLALTFCAATSAQAAILTTSQTVPDPILDPFFPIIGTFDITGTDTTFEDGFTASFDPFDTSLGTLVGARLNYFTNVGSFGDVQTLTSPDGSFTAGIQTRLESAAFAPGIIASDADEIPTTPFVDVDSFSLSANLTGGVEATDLTPFLGVDPILARLFNGYAFTGSNAEFFAIAEQTAEITLTYTYDTDPTPVVPLPAGGVLLLSGLIGFGALRRRSA